MAIVEIKTPNDLSRRIKELSDQAPAILDKCVTEAGKVAEDAIRSELRSVLSQDHINGELINALGVSAPRVDSSGVHNVKVGFREPRKKDGKQNAMVANMLEYGTSKMKARPFMAPAKRKSKKAVEETIVRVFEEEVEKLGNPQ